MLAQLSTSDTFFDAMSGSYHKMYREFLHSPDGNWLYKFGIVQLVLRLNLLEKYRDHTAQSKASGLLARQLNVHSKTTLIKITVHRRH